MSSGPIFVDDSSDDEEEEEEHLHTGDGGDSTPPQAMNESRVRTSHAAHASTTDKGSDAQRVAALQQELNEVRKSQRALAAKLIKKGDSASALSVESAQAEESMAASTIARTIGGLEEELEALRRSLADRTQQLRTQERELSRLKKAAQRAAAGAAAAEAAREEAARGAEEEVERLQAELVASRVRQEDAATKQREAQSSLKEAHLERSQREKRLVQEAKDAAEREWRSKLALMEEQADAARADAAAAAALAVAERGGFAAHGGGDGGGSREGDSALYAAARMQAGQRMERFQSAARGDWEQLSAGHVQAEFNSFKAMTQRMIKQKDEELARLLHLEEGSVARSAAAVLAEQTRLLDTVPPATRQALLARVVVAGGAVAVMVLFYVLYHAYTFAGSLRCFFDLLGFRFGDGCSVAQRLATGHRVSL